jgi:hypothetical protein
VGPGVGGGCRAPPSKPVLANLPPSSRAARAVLFAPRGAQPSRSCFAASEAVIGSCACFGQRLRPRLMTRLIFELAGNTRPGRRLWEMTIPFLYLGE